MTRRYINQLGERETINEVFLVSDKQLRTNRNGNLYLQLRLADRTGSVNAMLWNANDQVYGSFDNGDFIRVQATTQFYSGALQMIVQRIERVNPDSVDESEFTTLNTIERDRLAGRMAELLRAVNDAHLRALGEGFLMDDALMDKLMRAPAGVKNHHAYQGGLLEHVVSLMELCALVAGHYPEVDRDLLMLGAFLHDIGKIDELTYERDLGYSDHGQMIGHLIIGVELLNEKLPQAAELTGDEFPAELAMRLKHMILSHHGQYEFGSPRLPMTLEAIVLHFLDNLDAKVHSFSQLISMDVNTESNWTPYHAMLGRKLYKGRAATADKETPS